MLKNHSGEFCADGLGFDIFDLDTDMTEFKDDLAKYASSNQENLGFGVSPSHSSDSGVDYMEEDIFDFDSEQLDGESFLETLAAEYGGQTEMPPDVAETFPNGPILSGKNVKSNLVSSSNGEKVASTISEDHCYTIRNFEPKDGYKNRKELTMSSFRSETASVQDVEIKEKQTSSVEKMKAKKEHKDNLEMDDLPSDRCTNRNAIMARLNRQRKKRYVSNLESEVSSLRKQNTSLLTENRKLQTNMSKCMKELAYLKNVIQNQSMLSDVIKAVANAPGVKLKGVVPFSNEYGEAQGDLQSGDDLNGNSHTSMEKNDELFSCSTEEGVKHQGKGGICLHVQEENVSIEFCQHCSLHAGSV